MCIVCGNQFGVDLELLVCDECREDMGIDDDYEEFEGEPEGGAA